ncbi:DUF3237 domain-containing protein [Acidocella sp.]|jgi:hypothetical protein|uniref:DUF3237 domain-containing protein n=1 Tax=Acidocella sp. TaxID=50710 RepID=UPI002F411417
MSGLSETLPGALREIRTRPLLTMKLAVRPLLVIGETPLTTRRIGIVFGGKFEGERLSGEVLDGGSDWQSVRKDGSTLLDVRLILKTDDDALITVTYKGIRQGPPEILARLERGEVVDPESYYFRINPMFETASETYAWLNNMLAIGTGHRFVDGPVYSLFEVL